QPGIQTVCWDQRHEPLPTIAAPPAAGAGGRGAAGAGGRGAAGGGGRGAAAAQPVPGVPQPMPSVGYLAENPCGGGGGGGFGGGGGNAGPYVAPGAYTVALMAGERELERKSMRIIMDPEVRFTAQERAQYQSMLVELHELQ